MLLLWENQKALVLGAALNHLGFLLTFIGSETKHAANIITSIRFQGGMIRVMPFYGQIELLPHVALYYEK